MMIAREEIIGLYLLTASTLKTLVFLRNEEQSLIRSLARSKKAKS